MSDNPTAPVDLPKWKTIEVTFEDGIAWVTLNRPAKRNAMSPTLNREMMDVLDRLEYDDRCRVLVLTGAGEAFSAGMDLKEYFRETENFEWIRKLRNHSASQDWQWRRLRKYPKSTIAMVNGWCFGGAFTPLVGCDLAVAAEDATFGVSEVNWGIIPGGNVCKAIEETMGYRQALYYIMTGDTFTGRQAAEMGLVNYAVPRDQLRARVVEIAKKLLALNPVTVYNAKVMYKFTRNMEWELASEFSGAKSAQNAMMDKEKGRLRGLEQFLDEKSFRPGLGAYRRGDAEE
jgi:trans-feruloyl-CoA hydratase/vanillin synthase